MTNSIADIHLADVLMITGSNTTEAHPVISLEMKKAVRQYGAKLILVDPREIELAEFATLHLRPRSGTDVALYNAMAHVILENNLANDEFIKTRTENFDAFKEAVKDCTPQWGEDITGIPAEMIVEAAHMYSQARSASIFWAMGITQSSHGVDNVQSLANLALLTGNFGRPGTGLNPLRGQNNVQGACDMGGLPNVITGYQTVIDEAVRTKFENAWGTSVKIPDKPGLTVTELMQGIHDGRVKALYIMGENPMLSDPNINHVAEALSEIEFLVSQDIFLNETGQMAHVVLPGVSFAEKEGTYTNTERRVQLVRPALPIRGDAKLDLDIICDLGKRLTKSNGKTSNDVIHQITDWNYKDASAVWDEIASLTPIVAGMSYQRLNPNGLQWPCPTADHPGTPILHKEKFTRGLGKFTPLVFREPAENPDEEYPFVLNTGRLLQHWHGGTLTRRSEGLDWVVPEGEIQINNEDAQEMNVTDGDLIRVTSRRGVVTGKAKLTSKLPRGMIFMTFHFVEVPANKLTGAAVDPIAKIPEYKVSAVKVERV
ncbi:MAG: molybdopterin-dependent oxidoreductase [Anaerolineales bacterium]|nr:molybdopterin-dependent oxidoreductase [Anaerolineales bacterium]